MKQTPLTIAIRYFALLQDQRGVSDEVITTESQTPRQLYRELAQKYKFTLPVDRVGVAVTDHFVDMDQPLQNGDQVVFIPPVAGG